MKNKLSLKERILKYIRNSEGFWINGGEIERLCLEHGYKASNGSRRCRELENEGLIKRHIIKGSVEYQAKPPQKIEVFKVNGEVVATKKLY